MDYVTIPAEFKRPDLSAPERIALGLIFSASKGDTGVFFGTYDYLAEWIGCKRRNAITIVQKLEEKGYIKRGEVIRGNKILNTFTFAEGCKDCTVFVEDCTGGVQILHSGGANIAPMESNTESISENINNTLPRTREEKAEELRDKFRAELEAFRDRYPAEMLQAFFDYWAAPLQRPTAKKILKYQKQETWDTAARLRTWARNDETFSRPRYTPARPSGPRINSRGETALVEAFRLSNETILGTPDPGQILDR